MGSGSGNAKVGIGGRVSVVSGLLLAMGLGAGDTAAAARDASDPCRQMKRATLAAIAEGVGAVLHCYARTAAAGGDVDELCLIEAKARFVRAFPDASGCQPIGAVTVEAQITAFADRILASLRPSVAASRCGARRIKAVRGFAVARLTAASRRPDELPGPRLARAGMRAERRLARRFRRTERGWGCTGGAGLETASVVTNTFVAALLGPSAGLDTGSDPLGADAVHGWAPVVDASAPPMEIRFYVDGAAGAGVYAGAVTAGRREREGQQTRESDAEAVGMSAAAQEFAFPIPSHFADGKRHTLHAYTVPSVGDATVAPVPGSPIEFRIGEGVAATGPEEIVFDWTTDHCGLPADYDIPDLPVRAFRDSAGQVQLLSSHHTFPGWRMTGPGLRSVTRDCKAVMHSHHAPDPESFDGDEWIASPYTPDGKTVYALVHNEFHPAQCPSEESTGCWYNAITFAVSTDGGRSYTHAPAPTHLLASLPYRYAPDVGPSGVFSPSSIVHNLRDGYYYVMTMVLTPASAQQRTAGTCLLRTATPGDPKSWRAWGGLERGFTVQMTNPYDGSDDTATCEPVSRNAIETMHESLKFSSYFNKFLLVGVANRWDPVAKRDVWGFYYALSDDLITWTDRRLIFEARLPWVKQPAGTDPLIYPSVLDPDDTSRNFEVVGKRADLYFTRWNPGHGGEDRDLLRVPIEFF